MMKTEQLVKYGCPNAILDQLLGESEIRQVVASCWEAVASVQPCVVQHTK